MKVLYFKVGEPGKVIEIENTIEAMQDLVGGDIRLFYCNDLGCVLVMDEDGQLKEKRYNGELYRVHKTGELSIDYRPTGSYVAGDFFVVGITQDKMGNEDFVDISDEAVEVYSAIYELDEDE